MIRGCNRRLLPWIGLLAIGLSFVVAVIRVHPSNFFGFTEDDSIYFSSAKAIAGGKGYVLASFPGTPAARKYPEFYPWLLSWVWRWNPSFPTNLNDAIGLTVLFGLLFLTASFIFFRRVAGLGDLESLLLTAFCALHPLFLFYSSQILSDIPFAAFMLTAIVLAETSKASTQERLPDVKAAASGLFAGLAILMRILGAPVAVGIALAFALRRSWRQLATFCGSVAPFFVAIAWRVAFPHPAISPALGPAATSRTWIQTWAYYTNYVNVWKAGIQSVPAFITMLKTDAFWLLRAPADYFLRPWPASHTFAGQVVAIVFTVVIVKGLVRLGSSSKAWLYAGILGVYASVLLFWLYVNNQRFLIAFLPLFAAGLFVETKYLSKSAWKYLTAPSSRKQRGQRLAAGAFGVMIAVVVWLVVVDFAGGVRKEVTSLSANRAALLEEKRQAYHWLATSTNENARVLAMEDGSLYLYGGRAALRPFTSATPNQQNSALAAGDAADVSNLARAVDAAYWLVSDDDSDPDWRRVSAEIANRDGEEALPAVFRSSGGHVRIYGLRCVQEPEDPSCGSIKSELPASRGREMSVARDGSAWK